MRVRDGPVIPGRYDALRLNRPLSTGELEQESQELLDDFELEPLEPEPLEPDELEEPDELDPELDPLDPESLDPLLEPFESPPEPLDPLDADSLESFDFTESVPPDEPLRLSVR